MTIIIAQNNNGQNNNIYVYNRIYTYMKYFKPIFLLIIILVCLFYKKLYSIIESLGTLNENAFGAIPQITPEQIEESNKRAAAIEKDKADAEQQIIIQQQQANAALALEQQKAAVALVSEKSTFVQQTPAATQRGPTSYSVVLKPYVQQQQFQPRFNKWSFRY
uniref:Uncharacterized protein n=1 Tax=viral metagenome TaxID=1070528 RepID=A0A6C0JIT5_9ZZZZ